MEFKDYYKILGIDRKADQQAVTKAFRRLAREFHPDVNKRKGAEDRFKEINEAYQVLGDPAKRSQYDQVFDAYKNGGVPLQDLFGRARRGGGVWTETGPGGFTVVGDPEELEEILGRGGFSDFFQQLFGGGFDRTQGETPRARLETTAEIALEEAFRGTRRRVSLPSGKTLDVEIPPGVRSGQTLRLPRAADGQDIYLTVQVAPHRLFERSDGDLTIEIPITMSEAALGAQVEVPTLDGNVTVTVPPGTQTGRRLRLKGLGMRAASGDSRGDLYVRVKVITPTDLSKHERELFEALQKARKENPRQGFKR
ncbi:MAG TPA: DnaJ C-terminal domain-containing protein [bacterium]|nr:DnaJ C-terminal domain-containing protein [bacterium]